jgi:hypothetical protein
MTRNKKTEHAGAKNGDGHWGPREEAQSLSKKANVGSGAKASREGLEALNFRESYYPPEQDLFLKMYPQCQISLHSKFEKTVSPADLDVALEKLRTYQIK